MTERSENVSQQEITKENLEYWREEVSLLRETKGRQKDALILARKVREKAEKLGSHEDVVNLFWEEYLVGRHYYMYARDEAKNPMEKAVKSAYGLYLMKNGAKAALDYANEHNVESLKPRTHRFSGQLDMIFKKYSSAINHFRQGIELYRKMEDPTQRWNSLEFNGLLAEALILSGKVNEGIDVAQKTFTEYDEGDGLLMKEVNYYQWAVWKSGCAAKMWNALLENDVPLGEEKRSDFVDMYRQAKSILQFPNGSD
jgi:hypothetical protein